MILRVEDILREEGRHRDDLVARIEQRLQHGVERGAGAHRHHDVIRRVRQARRFADSSRHRLADLHVPCVRHVGVQMRCVTLQHTLRRGQHGRRRLDFRIAEREVEDLVGATLLLETGALFEHAADPRRFREVRGDGFGHHDVYAIPNTRAALP